MKFAFPLVLALAWTLAPGCTLFKRTTDAALDAVTERIPSSAVQHLDDQSWRAIGRSVALVKDQLALAALAELAKPITRVPKSWVGDAPHWRFNIRESPDLNAFALPGGTIAVNTGLILASESGLEVVGVLGHEVAHVFERHGMKSMVINSGASLALSLILGDIVGISGIAIDTAANLGLLKFSRDHEREADQVGALLLQNANYPSSGLATFFTTLEAQKKQGNKGGTKPDLLQSALSLLSTHPMSEERAQSLQQLVAANPHQKLNNGAAQTYAMLRSRVMKLSSPKKPAPGEPKPD